MTPPPRGPPSKDSTKKTTNSEPKSPNFSKINLKLKNKSKNSKLISKSLNPSSLQFKSNWKNKRPKTSVISKLTISKKKNVYNLSPISNLSWTISTAIKSNSPNSTTKSNPCKNKTNLWKRHSNKKKPIGWPPSEKNRTTPTKSTFFKPNSKLLPWKLNSQNRQISNLMAKIKGWKRQLGSCRSS